MIRRGEIWWARLPTPRGSEPGYRRPVIVLQSDAFNRSKICTVVAAVITSNIELADAPGNISLTRKQSGLPRNSVVNVSQIVTIDKSYLAERVSRLAAKHVTAVEEGVRLVLDL